MDKLIILIFAVLTLISSCVFGEIVPLRTCNDQSVCNVKEVRVTPCTNPKKTCDLKHRKTANIEIDFTPKFDSTSLTSKASTTIGTKEEYFRDLPENACDSLKGSSCPIVNGQSYQYKYGLTINEDYPVGTYTVKWVLKGQEEAHNCCMLFKIRIKK